MWTLSFFKALQAFPYEYWHYGAVQPRGVISNHGKLKGNCVLRGI